MGLWWTRQIQTTAAPAWALMLEACLAHGEAQDIGSEFSLSPRGPCTPVLVSEASLSAASAIQRGSSSEGRAGPVSPSDPAQGLGGVALIAKTTYPTSAVVAKPQVASVSKGLPPSPCLTS
jgi:hypothetical protein